MTTPDDMIAEIAAAYRETAGATGRSAPSAAVLAAMRRVPRTAFVRPGDRTAAHENRPLDIGHGQTISQPFIVALMVDLLDLAPGDRVLEVGTGSGYAAAVLAGMGVEVFTVENVPELARDAARRLRRLGWTRVHVHQGDGRLGWLEEAPFDAILVSAAAAEVPPALLEQLAAPGVLVVPVGPAGGTQQLVRIAKDADGTLDRTDVLPVAFVPLVGPTP